MEILENRPPQANSVSTGSGFGRSLFTRSPKIRQQQLESGMQFIGKTHDATVLNINIKISQLPDLLEPVGKQSSMLTVRCWPDLVHRAN